MGGIFYMNMMTKALKKWQMKLGKIIKNNKKVVFTYTYYIPAPPKRGQGYREKQFDKLIEEIVNLEIEIINIHCQSHESGQGSGMWALCLLKGRPKQIELLNLLENDHNITSTANPYEEGENNSLNGQTEIELPENDNQSFTEKKIKGIYYFK